MRRQRTARVYQIRQVYDATFQLENASVHVNGEYSDTKRTYDTMEAILDEPRETKEDVKKFGIMTGGFVCFDPRTVVTQSGGYIKSRFLMINSAQPFFLAMPNI